MGAYSPYPREINIYFLQGGVIYTLLPGEYRKENSQQIKNAREREKTGENRRKQEYLRDIRSYCEIAAITLFR
jgi:hypothetical protein|nr:MAG TPA: protein of unknown function (DUF5327) [Caudoviricetes sp.]